MTRCSCGKTFYAWHNPTCPTHPLPADDGPCTCCGLRISGLSPADQRRARAALAALAEQVGQVASVGEGEG